MKTGCLAHTPANDAARSRSGTRRPFFAAVQRKVEEPVQARMRVGAAGDRFEVEADRTADRVVSGDGAGTLAHGVSRIVQREPAEADEPDVQAKGSDQKDEEVQAARAEKEEVRAKDAVEEEEKVQAKDEDEGLQAKPANDKEPELQRASEEKEDDENVVQAKAAPEEEEARAKADSGEEKEEVQARAPAGAARPVSDDLSRQIRASRGLGNPLSGDVREKMGKAFGADMSGVRIHTDAAAVLLAQSLKAQAFTVGGDIYFGDGKFSPGSREGQHLLAHELTHTVQQGAVESDVDAAATVRLAPEAEAAEENYGVRPEIVDAIRYARGEIGKVNAKKAGADGKRLGSERLHEYFLTAFGGPTVSEAVIDKIVMIEKIAPDGTKTRMDALPSWCGIFTWWAMKKAGIPIPDWKLGAPALDVMKPRPPGSLPRKGDIAIDVVPNNHFAMVTGLESTKDAEGKPTKMIRVATVNGNTAGDDNLGGQVQERWDTLSRWDHFLDPVGKMNLPEAPLVTVVREPDQQKAAGEAATSAAGVEAIPAPEAVDAGAADAELNALDQDVSPPTGDMFGEAPPEPDMSLPPPVEVGPAEQVAIVEKVELGGSSDQATAAFIDASPSSMALSQPEFGPTVDAKMKGEQKDIAANPPVLELKTSGAVDAPITAPDQLPIPESKVGEGVITDGGGLDPVHEPDPQTYRGNADREKELDEENSGSFWDAFMNFLKGFTSNIRTRDDSVNTSAGPRQRVQLDGAASPAEMDKERADGAVTVTAERDKEVAAYKAHPGQSNIQPKKIDESAPAEVSAEPAATIEPQQDEAVQDYASSPLPEDVRAKADAKVAAEMAPDLAAARADTVTAGETRDGEKKKEIDGAQAEAKKINQEADATQRSIVVDNRGKVAKLQGEGIGGAYDEVNAFSREAATEQNQQRKDIVKHVGAEEGRAKDELKAGEAKAEEKKRKTEHKAAEEKKRLKAEQDKQSWWQRAKNRIKSAVKAITKLIDDAFNALRTFVKETIEKAKNAAIGMINAARNWVVNRINDFRTWAKDKVNKYLKDSFPGLAKRINAGIDAVADTAIAGVNKVADAAIDGINKLASKLAAALDKILSTFQVALKTAVRVVGAVMQGDFAGALRAAIEGACEIAGIDPKPVFDFLDRAGKAIRSILKDPVGFIKKLFGAVGDGISSFFKNIKKHLIDGVIGWLTGALGEVNITGPFEFTPKGILQIVLQVLGLTYASIKARVIEKVPAAAKVFDLVEEGFTLVKRLNDEGPGALWEEIKTKVSSIKETVMGAIRSWLITTVIKEGIATLLMMTNPASAIVKAVQLLYRLVTFLIERYEQIKTFILTVYDAVAALASGNFTKVVMAVEEALAKVLPVLISLLANLLGLGGIAKQVKSVIETITKPINKAINWVVEKIAAFARKIVGKVKAGAKAAKAKAKETVEKLLTWWKERRKFKSKDGAAHSIYYAGEGKKAELMIASNPDKIESFLAAKAKDKNAPAGQKQVAKEAAAQYKKVLASEGKLEKLRQAREKVSSSDKAAYRAATSAVNSEVRVFRNELDALSAILQRATFENEDDALVCTQVNHNAGGDKSTKALPLTVLSGNTKGSSPSQDPAGWAHAVKLDTKPDGSSMHMWVRGHLLNDNLHGPGTAPNLVPITQKMNRQMEAEVESPAKAAVKERGKLFFYKAAVSFWKKPPPIDAFPRKIVVTWGEAARDPADKTKFKEKTAKAPVVIEMPDAPPAVATAFVPSINGGSPLLLFNAIQKHDKTVTMYFVTEILLADYEDQGRFKSKDQMKSRLWEKGDAALAAKRQKYVNATYQAITVGDVNA